MSDSLHDNLPTAPPPAPHQVNGLPRNPNVFYERTDVNSRAVVWFAASLAIGLAVILAALWWMLNLFLNREEARKRSGNPVAVESRNPLTPEQRLPPTPRLEGLTPVGPDRLIGRRPTTDIHPSADIGRIRPGGAEELYRAQEEQLATYGWVHENKVARIPIKEAMRRLADKLPARRGPGNPENQEPRIEPTPGRMPPGGQS